MLVSTAYSPNQEMLERAEHFAQHFNAHYLERGKDSLATLFKRAETAHFTDERLLIITKVGLKLYYYTNLTKPFYFHPSMGLVRINRLQKGADDPLVKLAQLKAGDSFLDCTLGIGADALVAAYAVGQTGKVVAIESDFAIATLVDNSLRHGYNIPVDIFLNLAQIKVIHKDNALLLRELPANNFDVVYFDPMFLPPVDKSVSAINPLLYFADYRKLEPETVIEAIRIARRMVILKADRKSPEFKRLGFKEQLRSANFSYGTIMK
jgi:16S rRNA G966 N2-methylase RsmD